MLFINYSKNQNQILKKNERKAKKTEKGGDDEPEEEKIATQNQAEDVAVARCCS